MYGEVAAAAENRKNTLRLWLILGLGIAFLVFVTASIVYAYVYYTGFQGYLNDISEVTNMNYRKGSVLVTTEDEQFYLSKENIYLVYTNIVNSGRGRPGEVPEREPDAVLEYKFGGKFEFWEVEVKGGNSSRKTGLFIAFTNREGEVYAYDTDRLDLGRFPLEKWQNE